MFHYSRCGILSCCDKGMYQGQGHVITSLCPWHLLLSQYCGYAILSCVALSYKERQMCATLLATICYSYHQKQCTYWPHTDGRQSFLPNLCSVEKWSYWRCFTVEVPSISRPFKCCRVIRGNGLKLHHTMTSSNGNTLRVTGPLWGESTGHRWISRTKASNAVLWCFLWSVPEQTVEQTTEAQVIRYAITPIMTTL